MNCIQLEYADVKIDRIHLNILIQNYCVNGIINLNT